MRAIRNQLDVGLSKIAARVNAAFADDLRRRFDAAVADYDRPVAIQHLRNLVLACAFEQGPPDLRRLLQQHDARTVARLRSVVPTFDQELIDLLQTSVPGAVLHPRSVARRCLLLISDVTRHSTGPHMRQVCAYATVLAMHQAIESVRVLITQELGPEGPRVTDGAIDATRIAELKAEVRFLGSPETASKIEFVTPQRRGPVWPYVASFDAALEFRPDIILAFQGIFESRVLPPVLSRQVPTVAVQFNARNPEPEYCDLVLAQGRHADFSDKPNPEKWHDHPIAVLPLPKSSSVDETGLGPPCRIRIITAIGNGRLDRLLLANEGALLDQVIEFLDLHDDAVWLMVGLQSPDMLKAELAARRPHLAERLRFMPRVPDVRALYEHCHIYMSPPGEFGGGMATAMAVAERLAVVAPAYADSANFIAPATQYQTAAEGFQALAHLTRNDGARAHVAAQQSAYMETHNSYAHASEKLRELLPLSFVNFQKRRSAASGHPDAVQTEPIRQLGTSN